VRAIFLLGNFTAVSEIKDPKSTVEFPIMEKASMHWESTDIEQIELRLKKLEFHLLSITGRPRVAIYEFSKVKEDN